MDKQEFLKQHMEQWGEEFERLVAADPGLGLTAFVLASDNVSARQMAEAVERGERTVEEALWMVGSFARLDWAIEWLPEARLLELLPRLWPGSDPDDTRSEYLALWRRAFERNGRRVICDGEPLSLRQDRILLYRGQAASDPLGICWTLNEDVAQSFAEGAGVRRPLLDGIIIEKLIPARAILAYLTGRGEDEVIVDIERAGLTDN